MTKPFSGKYASLGEALMSECTPGKRMPDWLFESLCVVFDGYARGEIKDVADALGLKALRPKRPAALARQVALAPNVYWWITRLREQDPSIPLSKDVDRNGAYCRAAEEFKISASQAEKYFEKYRKEVILKFGLQT